MKKLYTVEIITEVVVLAESINDAIKVASRIESFDLQDPDYQAFEMTSLPGSWDTESIPFGDGDPADPDRTIEQWIDAGAAPKYVELRENLKAMKERIENK